MQEKRFQNRITLFTFALTILVIWVHSVNLGGELLQANGLSVAEADAGLYPAALCLERFLSDTLGQTAVPGFFMVSAFLFFRNAKDGIGASWFSEKWRRRAFSLLLPYLCWNLIYYLLHLGAAFCSAAAGEAVLAARTAGRYQEAGRLLLQAEALRGLMSGDALWRALFAYAYNPVFWYLQQLIFLTLLAPAFYLLMRKKEAGRAVLCLSFLGAVFWQRLPFHLVNEDAVFYYLTGVYAALHLRRNGTPVRRRKRAACGAAAFLLFMVLFWFPLPAWDGSGTQRGLLRSVLPGALSLRPETVLAETVLFRAMVPVLLFIGIGLFAEGKSALARKCFEAPLPGWMQINFFVYATHYLIIRVLRVPLFQIFQKRGGLLTDVEVLLSLFLYLILPVLCVGAAYLAACLLRRFLPCVWKVLSGGR